MSEQGSEIKDIFQRDRRNLYVALGVIGIASVVLIVVLAIVLFVDPFGWYLLGIGRVDSALQAMPADTAFYLHLDLSKFEDERLDSIAWAFSEELREEGKSVVESQLEELDKRLQEQLGLTFSEDVQPWIADDVGIGLYGLEVGPFGDLDSANFILAAKTRDSDAADEFLVKLKDSISEEMDEVVLEEQVQNVLVYVVDAMRETEGFAFCRSEELVLFSNNIAGIEVAIDAQSGTSLADHEAYRDAFTALPGDHIMNFYLDMDLYLELISSVAGSVYGQGLTDIYGESLVGVMDLSGGVSVEDVGLRLDFAGIGDAEAMSQGTQYFNKKPRTASMASEDTLVYFVGGGLSQNVERMKESLAGMPGMTDFEESMTLFEMTYGFDPFDDLLGRLDGEFALIITPGSEGTLVEEMDVPLSFVFAAETSDPDALLDVSEALSSAMELQGAGEAEMQVYEHTKLYELVDMFSGDPVITFGVSEEHFLIGSSSDVINGLFEEKTPLSRSDRYREVWREFPGGMAPLVYIDLENLIANIRENMSSAARDRFDQDAGKILNPMLFFAAAKSSVQDGVAKSTMILFVEME